MLKTLKRKIALVAVAALGAGLLSVAVAPLANAAVDADELDLVQSGSTLGVKNVGGTDTAAARAGIQTIIIKEAPAIVTGDAYDLILSTGGSTADAAAITALISGAQTITAATAGRTGGGATDATVPTINAADDNGVAIGKLVAVVPGLGTDGGSVTTISLTTASLAAGTYTLWADPTPNTAVTNDAVKVATITVVNAGAPASISWAQNTREISSTAVDYTVVATPKDASGISTVLVGAETMVLDIAPQTGVSTSQVDLLDAEISANDINATTGTSYDVTIDGNGDAAGAGFGSGSTIAGVTYTISGQLVRSGAAIGSPSSATYTRVSNSAGLTGTISFWNGNTSTATAVTSLSSIANVAGTATYAKAVSSTGEMIKNVTIGVAFSGITGTIRDNGNAADITSLVTGQDGFTTATFRPRAAAGQAGTGTTTASISAGASTISATLPMTVTAVGTTVASGLKTTVKANNGNGITAGTATTTTAPITSSLSTTSFTVTVTGLDAGKAVAAILDNASNTTDPKIDGTVKNTAIYKVADSTGSVSFAVTTTSALDNQFIHVDIDGDVSGAYELRSTITYDTAAGVLTTVPATSTTSFVAVSTTNDIVATVADQFKNPVTGGYVTITNNSVPAGVTAMTAAQSNTDASGKATMKAIIGATAGAYSFQVKAFDANGNQIGSTSTVSYTATADGAPGSVTVTAGGKEDGTGLGYRVWTSPNGKVAIYDANADAAADNAAADVLLAADDTEAEKTAKTGDYVVINVSVKSSTATGVDNVKVSAKGSDGVYLANATTGQPTSGTTLLSAMVDVDGTTANGGTAVFYAVATKVGTNTVTFTVGSKTAVATFDSVQVNSNGLATTSLGRTLDLSSSTVAVTGNSITQVTATVKDTWGNVVKGVSLAGTITGAAGRFAGGSRSFTATTDAAGQVIFELTGNAAESGTGTLTVAGTQDTDANPNTDNELAEFASADHSANVSTLSAKATSSATAALTVTAATAAANAETTAIKADVKAVSDTVATLSKAVTTIQSSVTELTTSFTAQIKSLSSAIAKISRAIAALSKKIK